MVLLIVNNSFSKITGLTLGQLDQLRETLSYLSDSAAAFFSGGRPRRNYLIGKRGDFSTGLLSKVLVELETNNIVYQVKDERIVPKGNVWKFDLRLPSTPYPLQTNAVEASTAWIRGILSMPTGSGKSWTMAMLINKLQLKTLVIVPNLELKRQLTDTFTQVFGSMKNITIENIASPSLFKHTDFDCLIIDEAHHAAAKTYRDLNKKAWGKIYYRYFFTATPFRASDEETLLMSSITGDILYEVDYKTALDSNMICPIQAYYIDLPKQQVSGNTWASVYNELVVNNEFRNNVIAQLVFTFKEAGLKTLCLVKEIKHGENLQEKLVIAFANGQDEDTPLIIKTFNKPTGITALIGTTGVLGEGVDTKLAEYVVIAGLGKSKNAFMQQVGRVMRQAPNKLSGKVIIFRDKSHKFTLRHFNAQAKILKEEYGATLIKLEI